MQAQRKIKVNNHKVSVTAEMAKREKNFPHDVGLIGGTFIMPTGPRRPSLLRTPKRRLRLEWYRFKSKWQNCRMMINYKIGIISGKGKKWPKLEMRKVGPTALAMHQRMYTAFVDSDTELLQEICCEGLYSRFLSRIESRSPNDVQRWTLHSYVGSPRVVSSRMAELPLDASALRQSVVRIVSRQSLSQVRKEKGSEAEKVVRGGEEKELVEYLVLQRRIFKGKEGPWKIWGSVGESDTNKVLGEEKAAGEGSLAVNGR